MSFELGDYVDVPARIAEFRSKYPEGSIQPWLAETYRIETITGTDKQGKEVTQTFIVYAAAAYRTADDVRPGVGVAYEIFPGQTPYTKGSEMMNAETSAWGRALIAVGAADAKKIASREEVQNRRAEQQPATDPAVVDGLYARIDAADAVDAARLLHGEIVAARRSNRIGDDDMTQLIETLTAKGTLLKGLK